MGILNVTTPIFLLIAIGYGAVRAGLVARDEVRPLAGFVLNFALPALIFRALAQRPLREIVDAGYLLAYAGGSLAVFGVVYLVSRRAQGDDAARGALKGMGAAVANSGFIGFPLAFAAMGPVAGVALALNMIVENIVMLPLALALAEGARQESGSLRKILIGTAGRLARMPMIGAIAAGVAFSLTGLALPAALAKTVDMLAGASAAVALFAIGGTLVGLRIRGMFADVGLAVAGKLLGHPLAVFVAMTLVPGIAPDLRKTAVLFASVPVITIYPLLGQRFGEGEMCSAALMLGTIVSFATITVLLALF